MTLDKKWFQTALVLQINALDCWKKSGPFISRQTFLALSLICGFQSPWTYLDTTHQWKEGDIFDVSTVSRILKFTRKCMRWSSGWWCNVPILKNINGTYKKCSKPPTRATFEVFINTCPIHLIGVLPLGPHVHTAASLPSEGSKGGGVFPPNNLGKLHIWDAKDQL